MQQTRTSAITTLAVATLLAGCGKPAVDDTAHLQALLAPFVAASGSKIETLPAGLTRATATDYDTLVTMVVKCDGKRIVDVLVTSDRTVPLATDAIGPVGDLVGKPQWHAWMSGVGMRSSTTTLNGWSVDYPGNGRDFRVHISRP